MNIAIIFAGGTGQRMNTRTRPKQFLELHGKPILVYTIEKFQNHRQIDGIILVSLESWLDYCWELVEKFCLTKVKAVVAGGSNGQSSIYNGLSKARELFPEDSVVLIHDGVRPLVEEATIANAIDCVRRNGSAITVTPAVETIIMESDSGEVEQIIDRSRCRMARAPQCFYLKDILEAHHKAQAEDNKQFIDSASMMQYYGYRLFTVEGSPQNIKITTPSDFYIFRAMIDAQESFQIFGL